MPVSYNATANTVTEEQNAESVSYDYDSRGNLSTISTESTTYLFSYDPFGNSDSVSIGDRTLAEYEYNDYNGKLKKITYGNGFAVEYVYNDLDALAEIWHVAPGSAAKKAYEYIYSRDGRLLSYKEGNTTREQYEYDLNNRITKVNNSFYNINYTYDDVGRVSELSYKNIDYCAGLYQSIYYGFNYDEDKLIDEYVIIDDVYHTTTYTYDEWDRLVCSEQYSEFDFWNINSYTYRTEGNVTSSQIESHTVTAVGRTVTYTYTYDDNGNITKIVTATVKNNTTTTTETRYVYDNLNQLVREDNGELGKTYTFTYDNAGNITSKKTYALTAEGVTPSNATSTVNYGYSDSAWGDLLTIYNGSTITYDGIGNPTQYNGFELVWEGRKLVRAISDDAADYGYNDLEYEYNADGLLVGKTELEYPYYHQYYYDGGRMIAEVWESEGLFFLYDSTGVIGMQYWYDEELMGTYWFSKNLQGDIVAMYGDDGTLYETYAYDAWGNKTTTRHSSGYSISCPFGYRSYYYDSDLGMYYLQTRYYDPAMGRFISADTFISQESSSTQGYNLYSYCFNNPITFTDSSGQWAQWFKDAVKWAAENWIKPAVDAIQNALSQTSFTYSSGITLSGSPGIFTGSLQCGFTFDSDGNIAIQTSYGGGITSGDSPGVSVSSYQSISNAPNYQYLEGAGYHIGGSYGTNIGYIPVTFGGDFDIMPTTDNDYYGITSNFGIGGSPGVEVHATWGGTQTITSINLFDIFNCCYEKIMGW